MEQATCTICHQSFPLTDEFFYRNKNCTCGHTLQCKTCKKTYQKKYFKTEEGQQQRKRYKERGAYKNVYMKFLNSDHRKEYFSNYRHTEKSKASTRNYRKKYYHTEEGRKKITYHRSKRRQLGFNILYENPFDISENIAWHHINNNDVVALPRDLHQLYGGGPDNEKHRENLKPIIEQIYL